MPATPLPAARQISPLIRFARWTALISGIAYGVTRYNYLAKREIGIQKHENEVREQYKKKKAIQDQISMKAEMEALGKEAGVVAK
ncbi:hypothetical protein RRG08_004596 [Elysia crispata]|uniref:ATP synthase F(0) complex subunit e, mitochondrial n=1 Tax=Elysia crispata TaxID=231223 RepID=A0AAE1E083_9GAST|nr:hypothetical protein RRG08_004596 [Elysia crispata]